jgi:hypothetical protein
MTEDEIETLSTAMKMKPGHKKKIKAVVKQAREELEKLDAKRKREEEEQEEKRKREKQAQEEQLKLEEELARIERTRKLQQAKAQRDQVDVDEQSKGDVKSATHNSTVANEKSESKSIVLPAIKSYAAFISHKKTHSKQGDSSSTLARSLKVSNCQVCVLSWLLILSSLIGYAEVEVN